MAARLEPDDIVQSAFRTFFRRVSVGEYDVPDGQHLWKLLLTIALNKARNGVAHHKAAKRDIGRTQAPTQDLADRDEHGRRLLEMVIAEITETLEPSQRQIIELRIAGEEIDQIARQTGRARRSVERVLQGFRAELAAQLKPDH
jgi:RNA polymerase sigma-70 factor (ECF subfamily)